MLKNKIIGKKIRNIVILIMAIVIIIGIYRYIDSSRAESIIELKAIASDSYGYLTNEEITLEAKQVEGNLYEIELPESINTKKVNQIESIMVGNSEYTEPENIEELIEATTEVNKIYLTKEQIESQQLSMQIVYDVTMLETNLSGGYNKILLSEKTKEEVASIQITEEIKTLYNKILRYEDEENGKLVEVRGYLPVNAELQVEEVTQEQLTQIFGEKEIKVAYDIKIFEKVETEVPADEADPNAEPTKIVETVEINPEDFGEICEVTITDSKIAEKSQVYHVKEDSTYEQVYVTESTEGNVSFEAESFSVYAVSDDVIDPDPGTDVGSHPHPTRVRYYIYNSSGSQVESGSLTALDYQWPEITMPYGGSVRITNNTTGASVICVCPGGGNCQEIHVSSYTIYDEGEYGVYGYSGSGHTQGTYNLYITVNVTSPPKVNVNTTSCSWRNSALSIRISVSSDVELSSSNSYQYYLSTSSSALSGGSWTDYTSGTAFSIDSLSGTYYLFVKRVTDTYNATSISNGTDTTVSSVVYHRFGPYRFDKIWPTITVSTTSCTWRNSALSTTITASDTGDSELSSSNSYQYYLSNSSTALSGGSWTTYTSGTAISLNPGTSGTYYLFVRRVTDNAGNTSTTNGTSTTVSGTTYQRFGTYQFDYNAPTITASTTSCSWRNSTLSVTLTVEETGGSGLSSSNSYQYYLSNSSTELSGGAWTNYTSGTAFSIRPQTSGTYYLFVRRIQDNTGNTSSSAGTITTASGVSCHRFGAYQFDFDKPEWSTENLLIDVENDSFTVDIVGTDAISGIAEGSLTLNDIKVFADNEQITGVNITLGNAITASNSIRYQLTLSNLEEAARQVGKDYKEWSGNITIQISAETLRDNAGNKSVEQYPSLGHIDTVNPDFKYVYSSSDIDKENKTVTVVFSVTDKFFSEATLAVEDLSILFDGLEPDWTTTTREFTNIEDIRAEINGENKVIGKEYTLVLSDIQQSEIAEGDNYLNYSGIVTIGIPAGKITDTSGNGNNAQTITIGIDISDVIEGSTSSDGQDITHVLPYIPEGYTHVEGTTIDNGYVIEDSLGNQYVWVEVPRTSSVYQTAGLNITQFTDAEYEKIENDLHTYTEEYRNLMWNYEGESSADYSDTYYEESGLSSSEYSTLKKKMLKSVYKNGGFYVGRYETGIEDEYRYYENWGEIEDTEDNPITQKPVIKANAYPYTFVRAREAQELSESFTANTEGYVSSLMFGVQWDLILKYLEAKGTTEYELNVNSESWGNFADNLYNITNTNSKYSTDEGKTWISEAYGQKTERAGVLLTTGASNIFSKQNIYDLAGNVEEYTLEYSSLPKPSTTRGNGYYYEEIDYDNWSVDFRYSADAPYHAFGFRTALYKDEGVGEESNITEPTYIPEGYTHVEGTTIDNGYVIEDSLGNQYVWVEVPRTTSVYPTAGLNITQFTNAEYEKIENDLHTYTEEYRNLMWNYEGESSADYSDTYYEESGLSSSEYSTLKKKMLKSVYKNGGFYVGRYETGIEDEYRYYENLGEIEDTEDYPITQKPVIKANAYPYTFVRAREAQELSESFTANTEGYVSSLMFGVQWDLILKYLEAKGTTEYELNVNSESWGNFADNLYNITNTNSKYSTDEGKTWISEAYGQKTERAGVLLTTGASNIFSKQNIYDLAGNVEEYTLEYSSLPKPSTTRGNGYYYEEIDYDNWSVDFRYSADAPYHAFGFRTALYKDEGTGSDITDTEPTYSSPSSIFDVEGTNPNGLHIGDFINYDAGIWTQEEIDAIQVGPKDNLVTASGIAEVPTVDYQFGGFTAGSSKNGNATQTTYTDGDIVYGSFVKDKATGEAITGWRVFDIEGDQITLISAGNPEDFAVPLLFSAHQSEYILTGNINSNWKESEAADYQIRNWDDYINTEQNGESATVLTTEILNNWYSKYIVKNADVTDRATFQQIYETPYVRYQNMIENFTYYWFGNAATNMGMYGVWPNGRDVEVAEAGTPRGIRILVTLSTDTVLSKTGTKTITGGNMDTYGGDQTYNVWGIQTDAPSEEAVVVDVVDPLWEKVSVKTDISETEEGGISTAVLTIRGTDRYFGTSSLISENIDNAIKLLVNGTEVTEGITKILNNVTLLTEEREVNGENTTVQYGEEYTITIQGFPGDANQVKIQIAPGVLVDLYDNESQLTEIILYNVLRQTVEENDATSPFLGESVGTTLYPENVVSITPIERQDIEQVIFANSTEASKDAGVQRVWDVSAQEDGSIIAWTSNTTAPYTVYIGSDYYMLANPNSTNLFAYIGYSESCTATETLVNLDLLSTSLVTNMQAMFRAHGYNAMTFLNLGDNFDTSSVTNMAYMFAECGYNAMTALDLEGKIDTSKVTNMARMFMGTGYTSMTSLNLGSVFNTAAVRNMEGMFYNCGYTSLTSLDLKDKFSTSNVTNMNNMFNSCGATSMTALDLGPLFTRIAYEHIDFITGCGTPQLVVYAPESIYADINTFKLNKTAQ